MKRILHKLLIALTILWPSYLPASDATNTASETAELLSEVIPIKYAKASELAILLRATNKIAQPFFTRLGERLTQRIGGDAIQCELEKMGSRQVLSDERSNSILIRAGKRDLIAIKEIIARLDFVLPQILVDAVVIEFSVNDSHAKHHVELQPHPGLTALSDLGLLVNTTFPFRLTNELTQVSSDSAYIATLNGDLDAIVQALTTNASVKILQRPRIQTSEGEPAQFFIGESRPYSYYTYSGYSSIQAVSIGITLEVTCLQAAKSQIQMHINKAIESANGSVTIANVGEVPITKRADTHAQLATRDGAMLAIGGYLETNKVPVFSEIDLLDHVPGGGYVNKLITYPKYKTRSELVFLMRVTVLPEPKLADNKSKDALLALRSIILRRSKSIRAGAE